MIALIVCTQSRSGLIGLVVSLVMFGFYARKSLRVARTVALLAIVAMPFATQQYLNRMNTMAGDEAFQSSAKDRITLWKVGLMVFADNPLVGTGFLTFPEAKMKYEDRFSYLEDDFRGSVFRPDNKKVTHNTYIQLLSDCGLFGAVPFILLMGGGVFRGLQARQLLQKLPGKKVELLWLCGLSSGISGVAVCLLSMDSVNNFLMYVPIVLSGILLNLIKSDRDECSLNTCKVC